MLSQFVLVTPCDLSSCSLGYCSWEDGKANFTVLRRASLVIASVCSRQSFVCSVSEK